MKQVWLLMTINCSSEAKAVEQAKIVNRSDRTKDVVTEGAIIKYKQLTWKDGYDKENLDEN